MHPMDEEMRRCVDDCLACHRVCLTTLSQHCLDVGGKHYRATGHTRLMLACAEICRTSAFFMELADRAPRQSAHLRRLRGGVCGLCEESARAVRRYARNARKSAAAVPRVAAVWPPSAQARSKDSALAART